MGIRKDTGNRPQGAQRCLKIAANRVGSVYRGAADYPTCTELNKTSSILFNLTYLFKALLPAGIGGTMVADWREQVKIEQNNCYCSIRAVNVVYGTGAAKLPIA